MVRLRCASHIVVIKKVAFVKNLISIVLISFSLDEAQKIKMGLRARD
jgi:hypothetical protein